MDKASVVEALYVAANEMEREGVHPVRDKQADLLRTLADRFEMESSEGWRFDEGDAPWIESHDSEYLHATKVLILDWTPIGDRKP